MDRQRKGKVCNKVCYCKAEKKLHKILQNVRQLEWGGKKWMEWKRVILWNTGIEESEKYEIDVTPSISFLFRKTNFFLSGTFTWRVIVDMIVW